MTDNTASRAIRRFPWYASIGTGVILSILIRYALDYEWWSWRNAMVTFFSVAFVLSLVALVLHVFIRLLDGTITITIHRRGDD